MINHKFAASYLRALKPRADLKCESGSQHTEHQHLHNRLTHSASTSTQNESDVNFSHGTWIRLGSLSKLLVTTKTKEQQLQKLRQCRGDMEVDTADSR